MVSKGGKITDIFQVWKIAILLASPNLNFFYIHIFIYFFSLHMCFGINY